MVFCIVKNDVFSWPPVRGGGQNGLKTRNTIYLCCIKAIRLYDISFSEFSTKWLLSWKRNNFGKIELVRMVQIALKWQFCSKCTYISALLYLVVVATSIFCRNLWAESCDASRASSTSPMVSSSSSVVDDYVRRPIVTSLHFSWKIKNSATSSTHSIKTTTSSIREKVFKMTFKKTTSFQNGNEAFFHSLSGNGLWFLTLLLKVVGRRMRFVDAVAAKVRGCLFLLLLYIVRIVESHDKEIWGMLWNSVSLILHLESWQYMWPQRNKLLCMSSSIKRALIWTFLWSSVM